MFALLLISVVQIWLVLLAFSIIVGSLLAIKIGRSFGLRPLLAITIIDLLGIIGVTTMLVMPARSEGEVYFYAQLIAPVLIVLIFLIPFTIFVWLLRLRSQA